MKQDLNRTAAIWGGIAFLIFFIWFRPVTAMQVLAEVWHNLVRTFTH